MLTKLHKPLHKHGIPAHLIFISDIPGVLHNNNVLTTLTPATITHHIAQGSIHSGMVIKTTHAVQALSQGVQSVHIGQYTQQGDLLQLLQSKKGTTITHEK